MERRVVTFRFVLGRRELRGILALSLLCLLVEQPESESLTITTYYPAAYGVYEKLTTSQKTILARESGFNVGIGTTNPDPNYKVDVVGKVQVSGALRLANSASEPTPGSNGEIYYNTFPPGISLDAQPQFRGFREGTWRSFLLDSFTTHGCASSTNSPITVSIGYHKFCALSRAQSQTWVIGDCNVRVQGTSSPPVDPIPYPMSYWYMDCMRAACTAICIN